MYDYLAELMKYHLYSLFSLWYVIFLPATLLLQDQLLVALEEVAFLVQYVCCADSMERSYFCR